METKDLLIQYGPMTIPISGAVLALLFAKMGSGIKRAVDGGLKLYTEYISKRFETIEKQLVETRVELRLHREAMEKSLSLVRDLTRSSKDVKTQTEALAAQVKLCTDALMRDADTLVRMADVEGQVRALDPRVAYLEKSDKINTEAFRSVLAALGKNGSRNGSDGG